MSTTVPAPTEAPAAPTTSPDQATKKPRGDKKEKETVAGVAIPGGALTGIIVACALLHFGGPLLLLGAAAGAAAGGTTAAIVKAKGRASKTARGGVSTVKGGSQGGANSQRGGTANKPTAGSASRNLAGPTSRPAASSGGPSSRPRPNAANSAGHKAIPAPAGHRQNNVPLRPSSATKAGGVSTVKAGRGPGGATPGTPARNTRGAAAPAGPGRGAASASGAGSRPGAAHAAPRSGPAARLASIARRLTGAAPAGAGAGHERSDRKPKVDRKDKVDRASGNPKANRQSRKQAAGRGGKLTAPKTPGQAKSSTPKKPKLSNHRVGRAWTATWRGTRSAYRWASPRTARFLIRARMTLVRWRTRANLVRLRHLGPNWWPGIAKAWAAVLKALIKTGSVITILPAARRWITSHMPRTVPVAGLTAGHVSSNVRTFYTSTPTTGAPPMADPVIIEAAEQIRNAFATIASDPASSMRGYEAALIALPDLLDAIGDGLNGFAEVTRDQFAVQDAVPDMLGEGATHAQGLGAFLSDVHSHYRNIHDQQIANYEEPMVGSEKWDVAANQE